MARSYFLNQNKIIEISPSWEEAHTVLNQPALVLWVRAVGCGVIWISVCGVESGSPGSWTWYYYIDSGPHCMVNVVWPSNGLVEFEKSHNQVLPGASASPRYSAWLYIEASSHTKVWVCCSRGKEASNHKKQRYLWRNRDIFPCSSGCFMYFKHIFILYSTSTLQILHKPVSGTGVGIQVSLPFSECSCHKAAESYLLLLSFCHRQNRTIIYLCQAKQILRQSLWD